MSPPIRVLVADDHSVVRQGIRHVLEGAEEFTIVAEAENGNEVAELVAQSKPDVVVLDISMPGLSGIEVTAVLRKRFPKCRVLILSMYDNQEYVLEAVRSGAHGYLLKDTAADDLATAIRSIHSGEAFYSPPIAAKLAAAVKGDFSDKDDTGELASLTTREREVLRGIARGLTNKDIATQLGISPRTVETHRESLMRKLGIRHVAGLTKLALETGLIG
ncbi:MAG: response regulator transcription factor [Gemmatimonadetes bacterium]|nr:response regulator transcription factor [Gemmatimonadota bacterium]TDJ55166.1 MAG: response regulator transcription factor [Gemmatimonadota bacterium]